MATLKTAFCCIFLILAISSVAFSESKSKSKVNAANNDRRSQIPASVWKELAKINSTVDFIMRFIRRADAEEHSDNFTDISRNVSNTIFPEAAAASPNSDGAAIVAGMLSVPAEGCQPRMTGVKLPKAESADVIFWPKCVPLQRCGGCCGDDILECAPAGISTVEIKAMKTRYVPEYKNFVFEGMESVFLDDHKSCLCRCRVTEGHCDAEKHIHDQNTCRCVCKENKALTCESNQKWDEAKCECVCRDERDCHDGEYFNSKTCSCLKIPSHHIEANPCASLICRAGNRGVANAEGHCECQVSNDWGESAPANVPNDHGTEIDGTEIDENTTTPAPVTRRPRPRPRPQARRNIPTGRRRPRREINKEDYIEE